MQYYCFSCGIIYQHGSQVMTTKGRGRLTRHYCTCGEIVHSCRRLMQQRVKPPDAKCDSCHFRFRCWTE